MDDRDDRINVEHRALRVRRRLTRAYLCQNALVGLVALLFLTTAVSFFLDPQQLDRAIGHVPPYDYFWNAFYLAGGLLVTGGLFTRRPGVEAAGQTLLLPGLLLNFVVAVDRLGLHHITALTLVFAAGLALRAYGLVMGWQETRDV